jgi:hypothetical protein
MSLGVHHEAVYRMLYLEVFNLSTVLRIVLMKFGDGSAVTRGVNSAQARIKLDYIGLSAIGGKRWARAYRGRTRS